MITFLAAIFVFGLLIISHEMGHFFTAKACGIKVSEFSVGMGPKLFGIKGKETNYSLRLFPIGGYVKMLGEEEESQDPRAFCNQSPWRRLMVIIAGAFMNFVVAIILLTIFNFNVGIYKPIINKVVPNMPAEKAGLKADDRIIAVNNNSIESWEEFISFVDQNKDKDFKLTVDRNGQKLDVTLKPEFNGTANKYMIGIESKYVKGSFAASVSEAFKKTNQIVKEIFKFFGSLFQGKISSNDVGGPVAIIKMSGEVAKLGVWNLIMFTAFLSINLGVINLIPFPALDGGWVLILLIEGITGKKADENKLGIVNLIGFSILMALAVFITYKDILKLGSF